MRADADGIARFQPGASDDANEAGVPWTCAAYAILRVPTHACVSLLDALTPSLLDKLRLELASRVIECDGTRISVSVEILLSRTWTHSGAHFDSTSSLLVPIVGDRKVWFAPHDALMDRARGAH